MEELTGSRIEDGTSAVELPVPQNPSYAQRVADIAVSISTRNRSHDLARCLEALRIGDVFPAQVVVVDQSTDDATRDVVRHHRRAGLRITYVRNEAVGLAVAQNLSIAHAVYPVVAVTDDDCVPTRTWLALIEQLLTDSGDLDALTGRVLPLWPDGPNTYAVASRPGSTRVDFREKTMPWEVGSGNNFAVKRDWLLRVGGNNEQLGPGAVGQGAADIDLFYRLLRAGAHIRYEPDLLVYHSRTTRAGRLARRGPYGFGMGACSASWLRERDFFAVRVLVRWFTDRTRRLLSAAVRGDWTLVLEEVLVLGGTVRGLIRGLGLRKRGVNPNQQS